MHRTIDADQNAAERLTAALLGAFSGAGFFRAGACLLGTMAYQTYPGLLGVDLPGSPVLGGGDRAPMVRSGSPLVLADIAGTVGPVARPPAAVDVLRTIDPSFAELGAEIVDLRQASATAASGGRRNRDRPEPRTGYINKDGYRVEVLYRHAELASDPETFLDFLVADPAPAIVRHQADIEVAVPSPQRFAVFLVMVLARRQETTGKQLEPRTRDLPLSTSQIRELTDDLRWSVARDVAKVSAIVGALAPERHRDLFDAWRDAWARGPAWQIAMALGHEILDDDTRTALDDAVRRAGIEAGIE